MLCKCDKSPLFPRCNRNPEYCPKVAKEAIWATENLSEE
jgi:hypothetical protein